MHPNVSDNPSTWRDFTIEPVDLETVMVLCRLDGHCEENLSHTPDTDRGYLTLGEAVAWAQNHTGSIYHRDPETPEPDTDLDRLSAIWADHTRLPELTAGSEERVTLANRLMSQDIPWLLAEVERMRAQLRRRDDVLDAARAAADDIRTLSVAKSVPARNLIAAVDAMGVRTESDPPPWPEYPFPTREEGIYLIKCDGMWPISACTSETHAIDAAKRMAEKNAHHQVRIWKVTSIDVLALTVQREIIREGLVPAGTQVES